MYEWLENDRARSALILTANRRLARELRMHIDAQQVAAGRDAWRTPEVRYWQDWLAELLENSANEESPRILQPAASVLLWEQCLADTPHPSILSSGSVVRHARQAWQRLHDWLVPPAALAASAESPDQRWYVRATHVYRKLLDDGRWTDTAQLAAQVGEMWASGTREAPARLLLVGFDREVPSLQALVEQLASRGTAVEWAPLPERNARCCVQAYANGDAEWRAAGAWARAMHAQSPGCRVAIVAPALDTDATRIVRLVREGLAPGWQLGGDGYRATVDVSYGRRLSEFPLIAVALLCLKWCQQGLPGAEVSVLLRSSFLGSDDLAGRGRLERHLRTLPDRAWNADDFFQACNGPRFVGVGLLFRERLGAIAELQATADTRRRPSAWAMQFDQLTTQLGWPGIAAPDSEEFQLINRWRLLLNELAALDAVRRRMTLADAVRRICSIAAETVYQPEVGAGSVSLLGALEAAGMEFDHVWVGHLDAGHWPPPSHSLALVRRQLQREHSMPDATPADTLEFARRVLGRIVKSSGNAVLSWSRMDGDAELAPSPLLAGIAKPAGNLLADPGWYAHSLRGTAALIAIEDDAGPGVRADEHVGGGAYTVQRQSDDPFSAFALARLGVRELDRFQHGLSARQRGTMVHRGLNVLFADRPTQQQLGDWSEAECKARTEKALSAAVRGMSRNADAVLQQLLLLERGRMRRLFEALLAAESERDYFEIVDVEHAMHLQYGVLSLDLRVDRIDRLADGTLLVIDYKTGSVKSLLKRDGQPADLQLCVYGRAFRQPIGGLLLLNIDSRGIVYKGVGGSVSWGRVDAEEWTQLLALWRSLIDTLLERIAAGDLRLNVRQRNEKARPLALLSRITELGRAGG